MNILTHSCFLLTKVRTYSSKKRTSMTFLWILYHFLSVPGMEGLRILILCTSAEFFRWSSLTWFDNYFDYLIWKLAKILWGKVFSYISGGLKLYGGGGRVAGGGGNITIFLLFHFLRNRQYPERWSVSFKNFFRECEYIRSCYLLISSNLLKKSLRKTSLFVLTVIVVLEKSLLSVGYFKLLL